MRQDREERMRIANIRKLQRELPTRALLAQTPCITPTSIAKSRPPSPVPVPSPRIDRAEIKRDMQEFMSSNVVPLINENFSAIMRRMDSMEQERRDAQERQEAAAMRSPPPPPAIIRGGGSCAERGDPEFEALLKKELMARVRELRVDGSQSNRSESDADDDNEGDDSVDKHELEYWRNKAKKDGQSSIKHAGTLLSLLANVVEGIAASMGTRIRLHGLSDAVTAAVENGDFDHGLKIWSMTPAAVKIAKNPASSFLSTFATIMIQTHLENMKTRRTEKKDTERTRECKPVYRNEPMSAEEKSQTPAWGQFPNGFHAANRSLDQSEPESLDQFAAVRNHMKSFGPLLEGMTKIASLANNK